MPSSRSGRALRVDVSYPMLHAFLAPEKSDVPFGGAEVRATLTGLLLRERGFDVRFVVQDLGGTPPREFDGIDVLAVPGPERDVLDEFAHGAGEKFRAARAGEGPRNAAVALSALSWAANTARGVGRLARTLLRPPPHPALLEDPADVTLCFFASAFHARSFASALKTNTRRIFFPTDDEQLSDRTLPRQRLLTRYVVDHAHAIVVQTPEQQGMLPSRVRPRSVILHNPVPHLEMFPHLAVRTTLPVSAPYAVWVGRDNRHKNPAGLLALASSMPDIHFVAVMTHPPDHDTHEMWRARFPQNVTLHRRLPFATVADMIAGARALVSTSNWEGFANTFVQAAAAGVPVASLHVDPAGLLSTERIGLFAAHEPTGLIEALRRLMTDDELHGRIAASAKQYVEQVHAPHVYGDQVAALVRRVGATDSTAG